MLARLPDDLQPLVWEHWAASVIQARALRWFRLGHVRHALWPRLRARLPRGVHAALVRHAAIRREWRLEPASWLAQSDADLRAIVAEAEAGAWNKSGRSEKSK